MEHGICKRIGVTEGHIASYDQEAHFGGYRGASVNATKFRREVVKVKLPSRKSTSPAKAVTPGATKLYSEVDSFKAFAEMNQTMIERQRHIRFYTTLLLKDLLSDRPIEQVAEFY